MHPKNKRIIWKLDKFPAMFQAIARQKVSSIEKYLYLNKNTV